VIDQRGTSIVSPPTIGPRAKPGGSGRGVRRMGATLCGLLAAAAGSGCEVDGWLFDPSIPGRWEHTPTIVPVLERIDIIESDTGDFVDVTEVTADDLIPEPEEYRIAPGDILSVQILDFREGGAPLINPQLVVDAVGTIRIELLPPIPVAGLTARQAEEALKQALADADILQDAEVSITVPGQRESTFSIFGAVPAPARYQIPNPDYRLLEALTDAGGVTPAIPYVFVIRQVPLTPEVSQGRGVTTPKPVRPAPTVPSGETPPARPTDSKEEGEDLLEIIDELTRPPSDPSTPPPAPDPGLIGLGARGGDANSTPRGSKRLPQPSAAALQDGDAPVIDLEDSGSSAVQTAGPSAATENKPASLPTKWIFLNGEWVQVVASAPAGGGGLPETDDPLAGAPSTEELVTQRVIQVPVGPLLQGNAQYNIVVRPGDVISVPGRESGVIYMGGPGIARGGVYALPATGKLTLLRAIHAAGGLSAVGIPERVDLTRSIGEDRQATIRLNVRAIFEGTQPDIALKPDDMLNFGTSFWAAPWAVVRNGYRMSYGFGFLMDRNFGNDVFGAPPTNRFGE